MAPSWLRTAEILEKLGRESEALVYYRRFAELWHEADPDLQPLVLDARSRIEQLSAGSDV